MADHLNNCNQRMTLLADSAWITDIENVTFEDIAVPTQDLPDPEPENGNNAETLKQQEQRWNDLGLCPDSPTTTSV